MLINELPDDCLIAIFEYVNDLDDLINCYKVCLRWSYLIAERTKKAKYLMEDPIQSYIRELSRGLVEVDSYKMMYYYPFDCVYYQGKNLIDITYLNTLFPNLIIFEYTEGFKDKLVSVDAVSFIINHDNLQGIIDDTSDFANFLEYLDEVKMLSCPSFDPTIIPNRSNLKQLCTYNDSLEDVKRYADDFPNLELLRTSIKSAGDYDRLRVPVFENLKILVLNSDDREGIFYGFQLMDSCPNLQSAHITLESNQFFVDENLKHECLQDLVIDFYGYPRAPWNDKKRLLMKYPNLKHLALIALFNVKDEHIKELLHILPNLELLLIEHYIDDRPTLTKRDVELIEDYCKRNGRSIKFYENRHPDVLRADWPQLSTTYEKVGRGFDFIKHYFLKNFLNFHIS